MPPRPPHPSYLSYAHVAEFASVCLRVLYDAVMKKLNRSWAIVVALFAASLLPSCGNDGGRYQLVVVQASVHQVGYTYMLDTHTGELWVRHQREGVWKTIVALPK